MKVQVDVFRDVTPCGEGCDSICACKNIFREFLIL